jgi:hypothetical protein
MRRTAFSFVLVALLFAACASPPAEPVEAEDDEPAEVELVAGQEELHRITLIPEALVRLGIETTEIESEPGARMRIPYSAVMYDAEGASWVYIEDGARNSFVRHPISVVEVVPEDETTGYAVVDDGPPAGTHVVTVGVAELYGTEFEVGH